MCSSSCKNKHGGEKQSPVQPLGRKRKRLKVLYSIKKEEFPTHSFSKGIYLDLVMLLPKKGNAQKKETHKKQWEGNAKY